MAQIDRQLVALLAELFLQAGQCRLLGIAQRLLLQHIHPAHPAQRETPLCQLQRRGFAAEDRLCGVQLRLYAGDADGGGHHVGGQCQLGGVAFRARICRLRPQLLDLPPHPAKRVEGVGHIQRTVDDRKRIRPGAETRRCQRFPLALGRDCAGDFGQQRALFGAHVLLRLPQAGLRGGKVGVGGECLGDEGVDFRCVKGGPPIAGDILPRHKTLRRTTRHRCLRGCLRQRCLGEAVNRGRRCGSIIRADRATEQQNRHQGREKADCNLGHEGVFLDYRVSYML